MDSKFIDERYLKFVRRHDCIVSMCTALDRDADHLVARGWREAKRNDYTALALCRRHHSERGQIGNEKFERKYRVNLWREVALLLIEYLQEAG